MEKIEAEYRLSEINIQPWIALTADERVTQEEYHKFLRTEKGFKIGQNCFVSKMSHVFGDVEIGDSSWIAAGAIVRGYIRIGNSCSVNAYAHLAGSVRIADNVRIAGHTSVYGFNHGFSRTDIPISEQPTTNLGVRIGKGVWIGANSLILDGVSIGEECIVGGGAVVTVSVSAFDVVGGNPARVIGSRKPG